MKDRLEKQFTFIKEADKEKMIKRQTLLSDGKTFENNAEHAWHMAIMTLLLSEYANEEIDVLKTISMILIHDIVEIEAGDTYAYDEVNKQTQKQREENAADKLYGLLPEDQSHRLRMLWEEFENGNTPEAKFARAMDRIQPMMLNDATDGKMWIKNKVRLSQILKRNEKVKEGSTELWDYAFDSFIKPNVENNYIIDDVEDEK